LETDRKAGSRYLAIFFASMDRLKQKYAINKPQKDCDIMILAV
jgi:hypothetical protein